MTSIRTLILLLGALLPAALAAPAPASKQLVPGKFIITLKSGVSPTAFDAHINSVRDIHARSLDSRRKKGVEKTYHIKDFNAYAGEFDDNTIKAIKKDKAVLAVEQDQMYTLFEESEEPQTKRALVTQINAPWGLGTISKRRPGSTSYIYDNTAGQGTFAYVVDSGIQTTHSQFGDRASFGYNAIGGGNADTSGHGTHVAGTIIGSTFGVAKNARAIAVKVFAGGSAPGSVILDGYNWAVNDIISKGRQNKAVINLSLGGSFSQAFNAAVNNAFNSGVLTAVAAGNDNKNAANVSPASAANAITVGAIDSQWRRSGFSNYGSAVDVWAPGSNILSCGIGSNSATASMSGTSMATPHVAGMILYFQALKGGNAAAITAELRARAQANKVTDVSGTQSSPNYLLYNGNGA
ncbi:alkaline protease [Microdochium bolleyi]|uniref:Alkaline protease n=1 Tax=Microdochium bolleyi TaxID=196109 RepID=A0A136JGH1_9PEZI|nr:alkaline protease [Microdochium bolleyi]